MAEPRPPRSGYRVRSLEGRNRWLVIAVIATFALAPFVAGAIALAQGWQPTGDVAIIALRSRDAWTADAPLLGQPTTGEDTTGVRSRHPGPAEFWVLGLTQRALGPRAGVVFGIALVDALALAGVMGLAFRRGGPPLLALTALTVALLVRALGASSLYDAFNSELTTYPMLLALFGAWSLLAGDLRTAPVLAAAATVAGQAHLAGATFVAPLLVVGAVTVGMAWRRHPRAVRRDRTPLLVAGGVLFVGWLPPLVQELSGPSNIAALWRTATDSYTRLGSTLTLERLATAVAPPPLFVRPTGRFGFAEPPSALAVVAAALVIGASVSLALLVTRRTRHRDPLRFALLTALVTVTSVVASAGQPLLAALRADAARWLWLIGAVVWLSLAWSGVHLLADRLADRVRPVLIAGAPAVALAILVLVIATTPLAHQRDGALMPVTARAATAATDAVAPGTYQLSYEGSQVLITVGPGVAYRLAAEGYQVRVDDNSFNQGYGPARTNGSGPLDGRIRISSISDRTLEGERRVATVASRVPGGGRSSIWVFVST